MFRIGQGIDVLNNFINKKIYFDLIFIDADKNHYIDFHMIYLCQIFGT